MKRLTYNIATRDGEQSVTGWSTGTPGLAVHKWDTIGWTCDHLATGKTVGGRGFATRTQAVELAYRLRHFDWTQDAQTLADAGAALASSISAQQIATGQVDTISQGAKAAS